MAVGYLSGGIFVPIGSSRCYHPIKGVCAGSGGGMAPAGPGAKKMG